MSHSLDFYFPRELKKRCYVLYFMFLFSYTSHCLYFIYLEWFETISESSIFLFFQIYLFSFNAFVQALYSRCPGSYTILFQGFNQAPMFPILLYSKFSSPSLYYCILDFQAPIPPIPFYSRFPGPYASYTILFQVPRPLYLLYYCIHRCQGPYASYTILFLVPRLLYLLYFCILGALAPMPPILLYSRCPGPMPPILLKSMCPGPYTSYTIVFQVSRPLCLLYHFILGSQAPIPPILLYSRCPGPNTSYTIVFQVPRPLCPLYYCILGAQAPLPPILFYSRCPGPYAPYTIVFQVPRPLYLL